MAQPAPEAGCFPALHVCHGKPGPHEHDGDEGSDQTAVETLWTHSPIPNRIAERWIAQKAPSVPTA